MKQVNLSLETAKQMYFSGNQALKAFALENYSKEELEKKELPKTWEELESVDGYYITAIADVKYTKTSQIGNKNKDIFKTEEQAKAAIAMAQLSQLMHVYNDGWVADWKNTNEYKYCLFFHSNKIIKATFSDARCFLAFKTSEIRDEFLKNFKSLILEAKPLL